MKPTLTEYSEACYRTPPSSRNWGHATTATHLLGDVSHDDGGFFHWVLEDEDNYYGAWFTGFGFINVAFPKETSRPCTDEEILWIEEHPVVIS